MYIHDGKPLNYLEALKLKHPDKDSIAVTNKATAGSFSLVYDPVSSAAMAKDILLPREQGHVFGPALTFMHPRKAEDLRVDYSDAYCTIM